MTGINGVDEELLAQIRGRDSRLSDQLWSPSPQQDRRDLLFIIDQLLEVVDDQTNALRMLQDGIGDIRTEIIKDM